MSTISDQATVTLRINGEQAKRMLDEIKGKLDAANKTLDDLVDKKAAPKDIEKARAVVKNLQRQYEEMRSSVEAVTDVMGNLDKVSLKQLEKTLQSLNRQFRNAEQGTEAYNTLAKNIKLVKEQIQSVRGELNESKSLWQKFTDWALGAWPALDLIKNWYDAALSGLRQYVDAYADMDQEMASVRKYTGLDEKQIAALNEEFKKMDTRTSREELNQLAQEAGRLGKQSVEDVMGFVRAADKINVALDDLGDGATLTLSKLTGTFGVEEQYGTEQSLLKVGSVINELSQNCSASAPYIANFTERLAGVGAQANMTIPQIMGYAAVLDASSQKVEASSTALSQVIVRLYQDPAKYASVAGLEVESFSKLMREDANAAVILLLETLNKAGGMDVLSPMFKDMGENGSRAIAALSVLAEKIEDVKAQQAAANVAFEEGQSIDTEFAVQNNTVAANLDKCKNAAHELQVELGERLYPLMSHFLSTSSSIMRVLLTVIRFLSDHKAAIIGVTAASAAYVVAMRLEDIWLNALIAKEALVNKWQVIRTTTTKALSGVTAAGRLVVVALTNAYQYLANGLQVTYAMQERWKRSMAAMNFASWTGLVLGLAGAIWMVCRYLSRASEEHRMLNDIRKKGIESAQEEIMKTKALVEAANDENRSLDERQKLVVKLNSIIPDYNARIDETTGKYTASTAALEKYNEQLIRQYEIEGAQEQLREIGKKKAKIKADLAKTDRAYQAAKDNAASGGGLPYTTSFGTVSYTSSDNVSSLALEKASKESDLKDIEKLEASILAEYGADIRNRLVKEIVEGVDESPAPDSSGSIPPATDVPEGGGKGSSADRFQDEKDWRARQEAEARIAYARGEDLHSEYTLRMNEIAEEYYDRILEREDLTDDERLKYQADYWDAVNKLTVSGNDILLEHENRTYEAVRSNLKRQLAERMQDESLSLAERQTAQEDYQNAVELAELDHLRDLCLYYEEGSEERLKAQRKYQDAQLEAAKRHRSKMEKLEQTYASMKSEYFGNNPAEKQALYDKDLEALTVVYNRELLAAQGNAEEKLRIEEAFLAAKAALRKKHGLEEEEDTRGAMEKAVDSSVEWLNSDGGKAVTGSLSTLTSGMSAIFSGLSSQIQAELQLQTAAIEARYNKEVEYAEGNSFRIAKAEKKKEADIAKAKNEANKKMFAMQVIQAVAQTAQNALNAYGSAAAIPVVGHVLAPIAAAMAVAAGMIQIASIKKQQQASEAQGYSQGGFTKPGRVDEPAGVVHAGEWVASQKLLASPVARPMIEALDYAQRTNTIGSLRQEDVSRSITAPAAISRIADGSPSAAVIAAALSANSGVIDRLARRLDEPFVTVATVTGDAGIKKAQDEYLELMKNKSPKSRRNADYR